MLLDTRFVLDVFFLLFFYACLLFFELFVNYTKRVNLMRESDPNANPQSGINMNTHQLSLFLLKLRTPIRTTKQSLAPYRANGLISVIPTTKLSSCFNGCSESGARCDWTLLTSKHYYRASPSKNARRRSGCFQKPPARKIANTLRHNTFLCIIHTLYAHLCFMRFMRLCVRRVVSLSE